MSEEEAATSGPARLPRGRHRLSREQVAEAQRARMMLALADVMGEKGYSATSVAEVCRAAGVSRQTFYEQFDDKLACFLATFDTAGQILIGQLANGLHSSGGPADAADTAAGRAGVGSGHDDVLARFDRLLGVYLEQMAGAMPYARVLLVECHAAGVEAMRRRTALQERIAAALAEVLELDDETGLFACRVLVAAVGSMVTEPLMVGDADALRALRAPLFALVSATLA